MQEICVFIMPEANAETAHVGIFEATSGSLIQQYYHSDIKALADYASDRTVVVVVPQSEVVCLQVTLPALSPRSLREALPYACEDQLIADPLSLHYTMMHYVPNAPSDVLVVDKARMREWLQFCDTSKVVPDVFIPSAFMLRPEPSAWTVMVHEMALVRVSEAVGFATDVANLNVVLNQAMKVYGEPSTVYLSHLPEVVCELKLPVPVIASTMSASLMIDKLLQPVLPTTAINLLHGEFQSRKKQLLKQTKLKQGMRTGVVAWAMLLLLMPMVSWLMLETKELQLQSEMKTIYQQYFPKSSAMVAQRLRLEEMLKQQTEGKGDATFFRLLASVSKVTKGVSGVQIKQLNYQASVLRLTVSAQTPADFSAWNDALSLQGLNVKQQTADLVGGRVNAIVFIR